MVPLTLLLGAALCVALVLAILRKALAWPLGKAPIGPAALAALLALLFVSAPDLQRITEAAFAEAARGPWPALPAEAPGEGAVAAYLAFAALGYAAWRRMEGGAEGRRLEKPPGHRRRLPPPPPKGALPPAGEA
jgi:hypothetical protein